jgi:hypothetical protein
MARVAAGAFGLLTLIQDFRHRIVFPVDTLSNQQVPWNIAMLTGNCGVARARFVREAR